MEKTPRYTQRERNMVLGYAAQYKDVIENKRTDAESNRKKDEVWLQIAKEFNSKVYHQRSAKQLRQLYKNMKLLLKKDLCGEEKGNRSFLDLLNTLSQQESAAQYMAGQMSPDGAGSQANTNGRHLADDYEDSKPLYEGMDTDVILIKSETISDNEQTENGMDCMDDDDDDDCPSPKAPEVCLEEEDEVLFATDLRQLQQQGAGGSLPSANSGNLINGLSMGNGCNSSDPLPRATSSPVCSTKTSVSSSGSYMSGGGGGVPKAEITVSTTGNIRVGSFASISKTLQNEAANSSNNNSNSCTNNNNNNNSNNNNGSSSNNNNNGSSGLQLTAEQIKQHMLLNGLGLSAVQHPPAHALPAAISGATGGVASGRHSTQTLQLPRLARGHNANVASAAAVDTNGGSSAGSVQLLLNGHQSREKAQAQHQQQQQQQHQQLHQKLQEQFDGLSFVAGSFNGYNGLGASNMGTINCVATASSNNISNSINNNNNNINNNSSSHNHNNSAGNMNNLSSSSGGGGSGSSARGQHNEYMMRLAQEERKRKIELINAQIVYWQTLTKKLDSQTGHYPNPACLCHFPGSSVMGVGVGAGAGVGVSVTAGSTAAANALQTQSSSS